MKLLKIILSPLALIVVLPLGLLLMTPWLCKTWFEVVLENN